MCCVQALVVRIRLPGLQQGKQAQLNIESQQLTLSVTGKYHLQLPLPYKVAEADGTASFSSGKQQLEVILPVAPPSQSAKSADVASQKMQQQGRGAQSFSRDSDSSDHTSSSISPAAAVAADAASYADANSATAGAEEVPSSSHSQRQSSVNDTTAQQGSDRQIQPLTDNQRRWLEMHPKLSADRHATDDNVSAHAPHAINQDTLQAQASAGEKHQCIVFWAI